MVIAWNELRDARERAGLTQEELGVALGVSTRTITNWEATGVPRKSEYKVERYFGENLQRTASDESATERERKLQEALSQIDRQFGPGGTMALAQQQELTRRLLGLSFSANSISTRTI